MNRFLFLFALLAALFVGACGAESHDHADHVDEPADEHNHEEGAHGGPLVVLGDHVAHVEVVHGGGDALDVWITDGSFGALEPDEAPVLNLVIEGEGSVRIVAEKHEDGWRFVHEAFAGHPENARLNVKIGGRTFTPDLPHGHADHADHDDHEMGD